MMTSLHETCGLDPPQSKILATPMGLRELSTPLDNPKGLPLRYPLSRYFATLVLQPIERLGYRTPYFFKSESQLEMDSKSRNQAKATIIIQNISQVEHCNIILDCKLAKGILTTK